MAEQNKKEQNNTEVKPQEKKKSKVVLYIVLGIVALFVIVGIVAFFIVRGLFKTGIDFFESSKEQIEEVVDDEGEDEETTDKEDDSDTEEWKVQKSTDNGVDDDLESEDMLSSEFPEDIPLSGGKVKSSSYDDLSIDAVLDVDNTVEEIKDWYLDALEENGWAITSQSQDEPLEGWETVDISFKSVDGERRGSVEIVLAGYQSIPTVTVSEILY